MSEITDNFIIEGCKFVKWYFIWCVIVPLCLTPFVMLFMSCEQDSYYPHGTAVTYDYSQKPSSQEQEQKQVPQTQKSYTRKSLGKLKGFNGIAWGTRLENVEGMEIVKDCRQYPHIPSMWQDTTLEQAPGYIGCPYIVEGHIPCWLDNVRVYVSYYTLKGQFYQLRIWSPSDTQLIRNLGSKRGALMRALLARYPFHWGTYGNVRLTCGSSAGGLPWFTMTYLPIAKQNEREKKVLEEKLKKTFDKS